MEAEVAVSILVALVLVFTTLFDLRVSAWLATVYLIAYTIYRVIVKRRRRI